MILIFKKFNNLNLELIFILNQEDLFYYKSKIKYNLKDKHGKETFKAEKSKVIVLQAWRLVKVNQLKVSQHGLEKLETLKAEKSKVIVLQAWRFIKGHTQPVEPRYTIIKAVCVLELLVVLGCSARPVVQGKSFLNHVLWRHFCYDRTIIPWVDF